MGKNGYLIDKEEDLTRRRLRLLESIEDPGTLACLEEIGVGAGWHCLEVGAGGGSIASWLCRRVGEGGRVVATDLETRFLDELDWPQLEVRRHDVVTDEIETAAFDLVHTRNVLIHLPQRQAVLNKLAQALKPGAWILVEDSDSVTDSADPTVDEKLRRLYDGVVAQIYRFATDHGLDLGVGSRLLGLLRDLGFESLQARGRTDMFQGGSADEASPHEAAFAELKDAVVATGGVSAQEYDDFLALYRNPSFAWRESLRMSAWGRRPARP